MICKKWWRLEVSNLSYGRHKKKRMCNKTRATWNDCNKRRGERKRKRETTTTGGETICKKCTSILMRVLADYDWGNIDCLPQVIGGGGHEIVDLYEISLRTDCDSREGRKKKTKGRNTRLERGGWCWLNQDQHHASDARPANERTKVTVSNNNGNRDDGVTTRGGNKDKDRKSSDNGTWNWPFHQNCKQRNEKWIEIDVNGFRLLERLHSNFEPNRVVRLKVNYACNGLKSNK